MLTPNEEEEINISEQSKISLLQTEEIQQNNRWHVKLYQLNEQSQWDDNGTGYVFFSNKTQIINNNIIKSPRLIMVKENSNIELFNIDLNDNIEFHNQRGTILTWKTNISFSEDNIAISFQRKEDITEIWKNICLIKGIDFDSDSFIIDEPIDNLFDVNLNNLRDIEHEIRVDMDSQKFFQLENYIKNSYGEDDFIKKLGFILDQEEKKLEGNFSNISKKTNFSDNLNCDCENNLNCNNNNNNCNIKDCDNFEFDDNKSLNKANKGKNNCYYLDNDKMQQIENLSLIFSIFKNLIFQADQSLIEFLLNDEHYLITFGAFEFDLETQKVIPHRKYFKEIVKFKNILNLNNQEILEKIHMNNRLSYLRDTAIGRFIEDNPLKIINSMIQTNNNSIIQFFLNETNYIKQLFSLIENKDIYIRKDACLFLIELINCTKDLMQIKINFFETLSEYGILNLIEKVIIEIPNETPYQKYIDAIENKNNNKNEILKNDKIIKKEEEDNINEIIKISLIEVLINILTSEPVIIKDYLMQNNSKLIIELCKLMLCNENFGFKYEISQIIKSLIENDFQGKKNSFDNLIFVEALIVLVKYLDIPLNSNFKKEIELNKQIIIEILCHLIYQYNKITQYWLDQNDVCNRVLKLIGYGSKILDLYSIKFIKCILINCDLFYVKNFLNEKVFSKIQLLFEQNKLKENLIFSSVCDLFDYSRNNSEQILIQFFILNREFFYDESNRKYFQKLINKYEHKEEPIKKSDIFDNQIMNINLNNFDQKELNEKEDEIYFTDEKDFYLEKKRNSSENIDELLDNLYNNESKNEKNDSNKNKKYDEDIDFDEIS